MIQPRKGSGRPSYKHSYAKQYLEERNIEIYADGKRILEPIKKSIYKTCKLKTGYYIGESFIERPETEQITDYNRLKTLRFCIVSKSVTEKTRSGQRAQYYLKQDRGYDDVKRMPENHWVEWDSYNQQAKLQGPNTGYFTPWINAIGKKTRSIKEQHKKINISDYHELPENIIKNIQKGWYDLPEEPYPVQIKELPIMISERDEIVCIPQTIDELTAGVFGSRGCGKTTCILGILGRMYWTPTWNKKFVVLNDWQAECGTWCVPHYNASLILQKFRQVPLPLPCVYIYPNVRGYFDMINAKETAYKMTLPYEEIINNYHKYMDLGKSSVYFRRIIDGLLSCNSFEDVEDLLEGCKKKGARIKIDYGAAEKIKSNLSNILSDEITERNTGIPHEWSVKEGEGSEYTYNPITACMMAGLVPVFETSTLQSFKFFQPYFKYFVEDIFDRQREDPLFRKKNFGIYLFIDELHTISSTQQKGVADQILKRVIREGRPRRIGVIIADQSYSKVAREIRTNLKYVISFQNSGEEAKKICSDYDLDKYWQKVIINLDKFECLAWATDEEFVVYNRDGIRYTTKGPIKGFGLPPVSQPKTPKRIST